MNRAGFLLIGAAKAGTTTVYTALQQHPEVFVSAIKETNFFVYSEEAPALAGPGDANALSRSVFEYKSYEALFAGAGPGVPCGEASPLYLYHPEAAGRIHAYNPEMKLIVLLRNPVERAYSSYLHLLRDGRETCSFEEGLLREPSRIEQGWEHLWHYRAMGHYDEQIARYDALFKQDQMRIYLYEDLVARPASLYQDLFSFLGVDPGFIPATLRHITKSGKPRLALLHHLVNGQNAWTAPFSRRLTPALKRQIRDHVFRWNLKKPPLSEAVRAELVETYRDGILKLEERIGRSLKGWLNIQMS